jgi:hypothetical protein
MNFFLSAFLLSNCIEPILIDTDFGVELVVDGSITDQPRPLIGLTDLL